MLTVVIAAVFSGEKDIKLLDWVTLGGVGVAGLLWALTSRPVLSVILIVVVYALGFVPTFRKSYSKPNEETMSIYLLTVIKLVLALIALKRFALVTALYPAVVLAANAAFVAMLVARRRPCRAALFRDAGF